MSVDFQVLFNITFAILSVALGWLMRVIFDGLTELRKKDEMISNQIAALAVTIPENYVHKNDFKDLTDSLFRKLDRIEDKIDSKADKESR